jgi:hypothetical protein
LNRSWWHLQPGPTRFGLVWFKPSMRWFYGCTVVYPSTGQICHPLLNRTVTNVTVTNLRVFKSRCEHGSGPLVCVFSAGDYIRFPRRKRQVHRQSGLPLSIFTLSSIVKTFNSSFTMTRKRTVTLLSNRMKNTSKSTPGGCCERVGHSNLGHSQEGGNPGVASVGKQWH